MPRSRSAASVASWTAASHGAGSSVIPPSSRNCSVLRRSRAAIARVQAACTTGASSTGTTKTVRRMPSIRTSTRSSYSAFSSSGTRWPVTRAQADR